MKYDETFSYYALHTRLDLILLSIIKSNGLTVIGLPEVVDDKTVHDPHENQRDEEENNIEKRGKDFFQRLIRPLFSTLSAT